MSVYIDIHTHRPSCENDVRYILSVRVRNACPDRPDSSYSMGIHPWDAGTADERWFDALDTPDGHMVAVGEIGLDYREQYRPYETQREIFERQATIARRLGLPVIIHNVRASGDIIRTMRRVGTPWIVHGFTGGHAAAARLTEAGAYLSFGEALLHSVKTAETLRTMRPDRIFFETDESLISIREIYRYAAFVTGTGTDELKELVARNFKEIFQDK